MLVLIVVLMHAKITYVAFAISSIHKIRLTLILIMSISIKFICQVLCIIEIRTVEYLYSPK